MNDESTEEPHQPRRSIETMLPSVETLAGAWVLFGVLFLGLLVYITVFRWWWFVPVMVGIILGFFAIGKLVGELLDRIGVFD